MDHHQDYRDWGVGSFNQINLSNFRGDFFPGHQHPNNYLPLPYNSFTHHSTVLESQEPTKMMPMTTFNNVEHQVALPHPEASINVHPNINNPSSINRPVKKIPKKVKAPVARENPTFVCDICSKSCGTRQCLDRHVRTHNGGNLFTCEECGRQFTQKRGLSVHLLQSHSGERPIFTCEVCSKTYGNQKHLERHMRIAHSGEKMYKCKSCDFSCSDKTELKTHRITHNPRRKTPGSLRCEECNKTFSRRAYLTRHLKLHTGTLPFGCPTCGKHFADRTFLHQHVKLHDKKFKCDQCNKHFGFVTSLRLHYKIHTGEKTETCEYCARQFSRREALVRHVKAIHTNDRPFKCDECGKSFTKQSILNTHKKISHRKDPARACKECGKFFGSKTRLQTHMRIHNGEKPYECSDCGKKFSDPGNFVRHRKTHKGDKKIYPCEFEGCEKTFMQKINFIRHTERHKRTELKMANVQVKLRNRPRNIRATRSKTKKLEKSKNDEEMKTDSSKRSSGRKQRHPRKAVIKPSDNIEKDTGSNYSAESDVDRAGDDGGSWSDGSESEIVIKKVVSLPLVSKQTDQELYKKFLGDTKLPWVVLERVSTLPKGVSRGRVSRTRNKVSNHVQNNIDDEDFEAPVSPEEVEASWEPPDGWDNDSDSEMEIEVEEVNQSKSGEEREVSDEENVKFIINLVKKKPNSNAEKETSSKSSRRTTTTPKKPRQSIHGLLKKRKRKIDGLGKKPRRKSLNTMKEKKSKNKEEDTEKKSGVNTSWKCDQCDRLFAQKRHLTLHIRKQHLTPRKPKKLFPCVHCDVIFKAKQHLERHLITHSDTNNKPFACEFCEFKFTRLDSKVYHVRRYHSQDGSGLFPCKECSKTFVRKHLLITHTWRYHNPSRPLKNQNNLNDDSFNDASAVTTTTTTETPVDAQTGKDSHSHSQQYQGPPMTHTPQFNQLLHIPQGSHSLAPPENPGYPRYEYQYVPEYHNYQWVDTTTAAQREVNDGNNAGILRPPVIEYGATAITLEQNMRKQQTEAGIARNNKSAENSETKNKPLKKHICPTCNKGFNQVCHLKRHVLIHTGVKNFQCEQCLKRFNDKSNLQQHIRNIHTVGKTKLFLCDLCGSNFSTQTYLKYHLETHTAEFVVMKTAILKDIPTERRITKKKKKPEITKDKDVKGNENNQNDMPVDGTLVAADVSKRSQVQTVVPNADVDVSAASCQPPAPEVYTNDNVNVSKNSQLFAPEIKIDVSDSYESLAPEENYSESYPRPISVETRNE